MLTSKTIYSLLCPFLAAFALMTAAPAATVKLTMTGAGAGAGTITSKPAGINCSKSCAANFSSGTAVTLTATPKSGSTFSNWSGACSGTSTCKLTLKAAASATATFNLATVQLSVVGAGTGSGTITSTPAGINCSKSCSAKFSNGASVTLTATAKSGFVFAGWSGACTGASTCTVAMKSAATATATFNLAQVQLTVQPAGTGSGTVTSSPSGISCGSTCTAKFNTGTSVKLTAKAGTGSTFAGWSGACSGTGTCTVSLKSATSVSATFNANTPQLTVDSAGAGSGTIVSLPAGINCAPSCTATYASGTPVTLTATANTGSTFAGWSGACTGTGTCSLTITGSTFVLATFSNGSGDISVLNHIVVMVQENRSFDNYYGALRQYWADNGYPDQSFDGLPQFNPTTGSSPLYAPPPTNPGCDPTKPPPADCSFDTDSPVTSFHLKTVCTENTSPSWNEAHVDWNYKDQVGKYAPKLNAYVWTAAHDARTTSPPFVDVNGIRAMGYYDGNDLNYDYFMASNFATSDRFFNPEMARSNPNHEYLYAATSQGYAYTNGFNANDSARLTAKTIFEALQDAGISWKIYVNPDDSACTGPTYTGSCLATLTYLKNFAYEKTVLAKYPQNFAPISQYFSDLANGTLPQVSLIEPAYESGLDEHGSDSDKVATNIQKGMRYVSTIINGLMESSSWNDSAFILTYDEAGGLYDHVPPQPTVSPDGIKPVDLNPGDVCNNGYNGPTCDFTYTGYRIPLLVISPYTKKNYVSHTTADSTAILKFIETRFNLPALTKRDAAQPDMTEFFDFSNPAWMTPPVPPVQSTNGACYLNKLP